MRLTGRKVDAWGGATCNHCSGSFGWGADAKAWETEERFEGRHRTGYVHEKCKDAFELQVAVWADPNDEIAKKKLEAAKIVEKFQEEQREKERQEKFRESEKKWKEEQAEREARAALEAAQRTEAARLEEISAQARAREAERLRREFYENQDAGIF